MLRSWLDACASQGQSSVGTQRRCHADGDSSCCPKSRLRALQGHSCTPPSGPPPGQGVRLLHSHLQLRTPGSERHPDFKSDLLDPKPHAFSGFTSRLLPTWVCFSLRVLNAGLGDKQMSRGLFLAPCCPPYPLHCDSSYIPPLTGSSPPCRAHPLTLAGLAWEGSLSLGQPERGKQEGGGEAQL